MISTSITASLTCLIVDDQEPAHVSLKALIEISNAFSFLGSCYNAFEAVEMISDQKPDVIFLDIQMPLMSGLQLLEAIPGPKPYVIIISAFPDYAVDGFAYDVVDYLLKPFDLKRLLNSAFKIHCRMRWGSFELRQKNKEQHLEKGVSYIWIATNKSLVKLKLDSIFAIEAVKDYVNVLTTSETYITYGNLGSMQKRLPFPDFIRVGRSYILQKEFVTSIKGNYLVLSNKKEYQIPLRIKDEIIRLFTS